MKPGWKQVALGEVCEVRKGTVITEAQAIPGEIPVVAGGMKPSYFHSQANRAAGAVTVSASGANAGYVNHWKQPIFASDCITVEPQDVAVVDRKFVYWQLKQKEGWIQQSLRRGAAQPHVYAKDLVEIQFLLPPLAEQKRIAAILDKADDLQAKRRAAIAHLDSLAEAIFMEMFEGGDLGRVAVEEVASSDKGAIRTGPFGSQLLHSEFVESGVRVLGIDNVVSNSFTWAEPRYITPEKYKTLQRYTVRPQDVLVTIMGTCGRVAVAPRDIPQAINTKHLCCITLDHERMLPDYLRAALLFDPQVRRHLGEKARGAVMPGLNMGLIKTTLVPDAPLAAQQRFVARVQAVDQALSLGTSASGVVLSLGRSLQARAFSGEL